MNLGYKTYVEYYLGYKTYSHYERKNTETPVKILILKQIYTETSELSLEALR